MQEMFGEWVGLANCIEGELVSLRQHAPSLINLHNLTGRTTWELQLYHIPCRISVLRCFTGVGPLASTVSQGLSHQASRCESLWAWYKQVPGSTIAEDLSRRQQRQW